MVTTDYAGAKPAAELDRPASFRLVFAVAEYRALFASNVLSLVGDQLAKVALAFLVFERTGSAGLAATAFAASFLPWIVGGPLLAVHADRWPRRTVMIVCDLARAGVVAAMLVPRLRPEALIALLFVANLGTTPFRTARAAMMPDVLRGDRYVVANGLDNMANQLSQVVGFAVGGALVVAATPRGALAIDAVTFLVSAVLIGIGVRHRPAGADTERMDGALREFGRAARAIFSDRRLRAYVLLFWLVGVFLYAVEGLSAPLAGAYGGGARTGGLLLAAAPLGLLVGGLLFTRCCPPSLRLRLIVPLAVLSCAVLVPVWWRPPLWAVLALLCAAGLASSFSIPLNSLFGRAVPSHQRGRAFGVAVTGMNAAVGLGMILAGLLSERMPVTTVVSGSGVVGTLAVVVVIVTSWPRGTLPSHESRL